VEKSFIFNYLNMYRALDQPILPIDRRIVNDFNSDDNGR